MTRRTGLRRTLAFDIAALFATALLAAVLLAACGGTSDVPLEPATDSGIEGHVTVGPSCPVVRAGVPCPDRPYEAELTILDGSGREVATAHSDAGGSYRIALAPGRYRVIPLSPPGLPLPRAQAVEVTVPPGRFVTLDISYDSGIR